jgi:hypothetical protein
MPQPQTDRRRTRGQIKTLAQRLADFRAEVAAQGQIVSSLVIEFSDGRVEMVDVVENCRRAA